MSTREIREAFEEREERRRAYGVTLSLRVERLPVIFSVLRECGLPRRLIATIILMVGDDPSDCRVIAV